MRAKLSCFSNNTLWMFLIDINIFEAFLNLKVILFTFFILNFVFFNDFADRLQSEVRALSEERIRADVSVAFDFVVLIVFLFLIL